MLEAIDLTKSFGSQVAVSNLNLRIALGEVFCMLGANGAGKITTINLFSIAFFHASKVSKL